VVLKRFTRNSGHPAYWALSELGKAGFLSTVITWGFETWKSIVFPFESTARYRYIHWHLTFTYVSSTRQESLVDFRWRRTRLSNSGPYWWTHRMIVVWTRDSPRSSIISTKSRKLRLYRRYHLTVNKIISGW